MNSKKPLIAAVLSGLLAAAGCSTLDVHADKDPAADFSKYKTYEWTTKSKGAEATDVTGHPSDLVEDRIHRAVEAQLNAKGLRPVDAAIGEKPDIYVTDHTSLKERIEGDWSGVDLGLGYGFGPWYGMAWNAPYAPARQYTEGTLVIDLIDADTHRLVWRGIATDEAPAPEKSAEKVDQAVAETFKKFPIGPGATGAG
jgi:hypothetical protein